MKYPQSFQQVSLRLGISCLLFTGCQEKAATEREKSKPNVLIIYTDDQGSIDLNCYGAEDLATPNMDKLAETGVRFTQFYAASPVSSPSRAALMTGKLPRLRVFRVMRRVKRDARACQQSRLPWLKS